ncbi:sigma-E processing peptidase SpoIIGA [Cohnella faecalis]|uniref:sigma-E processing peptidase SpoIIGA n=1 Tax=Cohnella faecalis TaxID=2315694 RepID=UPI003609F8A2
MVVYVDIVFFNNLAIDGTVLLTTAKVLRLRPSKLRLFGSAVVGGAYAAAMFLADVPYLYSFAAKVAVSLLMVLLAFGYGGPLRMARHFGAFYTVNFATLGGVVGLSFLFRSSRSPWEGMSFTSDGGLLLNWKAMQLAMLVCSIAMSVWLFRKTGESRSKRETLATLLWDVSVRVDDEAWTVRALLDTGNRLYDPLTRIPVMIMEASVWKELLPEGWGERLKGESADRLIAEMNDKPTEPFAWAHRLRLVPYRAVNGNTRMMLAIKPDMIELAREGEPPSRVTRVLIGLDGGTLSSDGTYRAILHPDFALSGEPSPAPSQPA